MKEPLRSTPLRKYSRRGRPEEKDRLKPVVPSWRALILGIGLSLFLLGAMMVLDQALITTAAPAGIVSFELAGNLDRAERILNSWDESARIQAGVSLGLDYFFLVAYAFTLAAASLRVAAHLPSDWHATRRLGLLLAYGQWLAAMLDSVENLALIQLLIGQGEAWHPVLAAYCAWPKFSLVGGALLYIVIGGTVVLAHRVVRR